MTKLGIISLEMPRVGKPADPRLCELGALSSLGAVGSTALIDPGQVGVAPALSCSISGPLGKLARREFESFIVNWSGIPISDQGDTTTAEAMIEDPNIADLMPTENEPAAISEAKLGTVAGRLSFISPGRETEIFISETQSAWWLPLSGRAGLLDAPQPRPEPLDLVLSTEIASLILSSDAILILISAANPPPPPMIEKITRAFSQASYMAAGPSTSQMGARRELSRPKRIVFGIADCGQPLCHNGYEGALEGLTAGKMFEATVLPTLVATNQLFSEIQRLKMGALDHEQTEVLAVPYDFFGDLAGLDLMNRDPAAPNAMRLRHRDIRPGMSIYEPGTIWRPFNLADPYIIALTGSVSHMSFDLCD